ncbi:MAG: class I SAM-dependent methyltransferase [Gammaproteobacteria bacterium]|nr:class I SAM-dependent methyltransferase [Gammaproteobacteria bacterium]
MKSREQITTDSTSSVSSSTSFDPTKTALPVLAIKHATSQASYWLSKGHGKRVTPLSRGTHALLFVNEKEIDAVGVRSDADKVQSVGIRARWINKVYQSYIKTKGCKQIIILGSGFDIRSYKKNQENQTGKKHAAMYAQVKFFEIDSDKILDYKEKIFSESHQDKNATYIRADYTQKDFIEKLAKAGVDFKAPTLFIWEGNIYYLDKLKISELMERLKTSFHDFALTFDYFTQTFLEETKAKLPKMPWNPDTGINNIQEFADNFGLQLIESGRIADLAVEYEVDEKPIYGAAHYVCTLSKK